MAVVDTESDQKVLPAHVRDAGSRPVGQRVSIENAAERGASVVVLPRLGDQLDGRRRTASRLWYGAVVTVILVAASFLRLVALDQYPLPIHQDELSNIYDGYCIATTGADRAGASWPFIVRAIGPGDYRPAMYAYLAAITTGIGGFSVWSGRLPAALAGIATVVLVFLLARRLLGRSGGLLALAFVTFCPVHVMYSRQAHEGSCLPPLFAVLVVYLLYRGTESLVLGQRTRSTYSWLAGAGFAIGLSTSVYGAQRLTGFLFAAVGVLVIAWEAGRRQGAWKMAFRSSGLFVLAVAAGAGPQLYAAATMTDQFFARTHNALIPMGNGVMWLAKTTSLNLLRNLDPDHLFFSFGTHSEMSFARLSVVAFPFLYFGLAWASMRCFRRRGYGSILLLSAVLICLSPGILSQYVGSTQRASGVWAIYPILSSMGVIVAAKALRAAWNRLLNTRRTAEKLPADRIDGFTLLATAAACLVVAAVGLQYVVRFVNRPDWNSHLAQNHLVQMGLYLRDHDEEFDRIYVDTPGVFGHLYLAAFSGMTPAEFQRTPREGFVTRDGWEKFQRFGRFRFASSDQARTDWEASSKDETWLLMSMGEEPFVFK